MSSLKKRFFKRQQAERKKVPTIKASDVMEARKQYELCSTELTVFLTLAISVDILDKQFGKLQKKQERYKNFASSFATYIDKAGSDFTSQAFKVLEEHDIQYQFNYIDGEALRNEGILRFKNNQSAH